MASAEMGYDRVMNPIDLIEQLAASTTGPAIAPATMS